MSLADSVRSPDHHHRQYAPSSPGLPKDARPRTSSHGGLPQNGTHHERESPESAAPAVQQPSALSPAPSNPTPAPSTPTPAQKIPTKRPTLLGRASSEKPQPGSVTPPEPRTTSRKNSWISSISSKFSSQNSPAQTTQVQAQGSSANQNAADGVVSTANGALNGIQAAANGNHTAYEPYVPQQPKGSFISNALRRLSSGSQVGGLSGKAVPNGGVCPRKVMNIDPNRARCLVPELNQNKLRRVAFCVDVEIAGGPKYKDDEDSEERKQKRKKLKERGEGEALKHPESVAEEKDRLGAVKVCSAQEVVGNEQAPNPEGTVVNDETAEPSKKKEKKKRSEAERKERKEKKRRKAEENGSIPLEITREDDEINADGALESPTKAAPKHQDRPTTDPLRIYRRCCQLRETPILKRISDQLSNPSAAALSAPGTVTCLDLTGSRLQLADVITLSDWLAVVPVKKLFLEDADLNDEKIRVILAGLLAAKVPEAGRRRKSSSGDVEQGSENVEERSGVVKKLVLKNNPKITAEGWRHVALFIYMCKSLMALDLSMIPFPSSPPQPASPTANGSPGLPSDKKATPRDIAETMSKAISERLGGSKLEELLLSECGLSSPSIRKVVDGAIISGVQRLGLAGNSIDEEGIGHIIHYIKSGVCQGLDLGGNTLTESISRLSECFTKNCPLWALSVADCDLTPESLRILFPALGTLPNFTFLDLSHNRDLFSNSLSLCLLRKYMPQFKKLKRIHLTDVSLSQADVIGIAEIIPECPMIAHVDVQGNPKIAALAAATTEEEQEEAAAVYASLTLAAKVSQTIVFLGVDVPGPESNEVVKALAKQVIAYCLRNMQNIEGVPELQNAPRDDVLPDVLQHLVGHADDTSTTSADDDAAPDEDYIVGGTGVAKALSYCLRQKESDLRRTSLTASGTATPKSSQPTDSEQSHRAKIMSKNLLENARNIRQRLQMALAREAKAGNDIPYRKSLGKLSSCGPNLTVTGRLIFLDQTLQGMIKRFEDEYPETRVRSQSTDAASTTSSIPSSSPPLSAVPTISTSATENVFHDSDDDEPKALRSRHNSDVNLASRAQTLEEGRLHRLGHRLRTEFINPSRPTSSHSEQANMSGSMNDLGLPPHVMALRNHLATYSGEQIREMTEGAGWEKAFNDIVDNAEELKRMERENPEEFARFRDTQIAALKNATPSFEISDYRWNSIGKEHENAIED
ncbi:Microtubules assembly and stabilization protein [Didymosphaeria variabile]|uniref:Microtubules assembly and stabilization protein n=1 Tax=Didymosphaeria variabile TaxID=1932322 RepID=A0A9W8XHE4_9PLEO|nr:Microtubules assembly and stabilization protein [Didymosphaeria variabile]KAJ4351255.1 Microtubules assembly and stabilization protein [Didymosphaeria variabile]